MPTPFSIRKQNDPGRDLGSWDSEGNIVIPGNLIATGIVYGEANQVIHGDHGNGASSDAGMETLSRFGLSSFSGVSGQLWVSYLTAEATADINKLMVASAGTAAIGCTLARIALFSLAEDDSPHLVARTASNTTIGAATYTPYELPLSTSGGYPSTYEIIRGTRYALGFLQIAATPMDISGAYILDSSTPPIASRIITGQTDIATSYAVGALNSTYTMAYARARMA